MAITYKVVKRAQAGIKGGGTLKYQASPTATEVVGTSELARLLSARSTVRPGDVRLVLTELSEMIPELLLKGSSVRLEEIGIFSTSMTSELKDTPEEVNESSIKGLRVQFRADKWLKKQMMFSDFTRVKE